MALFETLVDDFSDSGTLATYWQDSFNDYGIESAQGYVGCSAGATNGLRTANDWTLHESSIEFELIPYRAGNETGGYQLAHVVAAGSWDDKVGIEFRPHQGSGGTGRILYDVRSGGSDVSSQVVENYDPTNHRHIRFREASGTTYIEVSPDGTTWTAKRTEATPTWVETTTTCEFELRVNMVGGSPNGRTYIDNVNPNTPTPVPGVATYNLTITHITDSAGIADRTYEIDATGSTGAVTLTQTGGTTVTDTESPTGVFTFPDPGGTDTLGFNLTAAGTGGGADDTAAISIPRGSAARSAVLTFQGGTVTDIANWT